MKIPIDKRYRKPLAKLARSFADVLDPPSSRRERKPKPFSVQVSMAQSELTISEADNSGVEQVQPFTQVGFGRQATGGRGVPSPTFHYITNNNASGAGSWDAALTGGDRIILPLISGNIDFAPGITIPWDNITIDCRLAPGGRVTWQSSNITNDTDFLTFTGSNIRVINLRVRSAVSSPYGSNRTGINLLPGANNIYFRGCSVAYGSDENFSMAAYGAEGLANPIEDITLDRCLMSYPVSPNQFGSLFDGHVNNLSVYKCLYYGSQDRSPTFSCNGNVELVNCVVADCGRGTEIYQFGAPNVTGNSPKVNAVGNVYTRATTITNLPGGSRTSHPFANQHHAAGDFSAQVYLAGNITYGETTPAANQAALFNPQSGADAVVQGTPAHAGSDLAANGYADALALAANKANLMADVLGNIGARPHDTSDAAIIAGINADSGQGKASQPSDGGGVQTIPVEGPLTPKASWEVLSGGFYGYELEIAQAGG